MRLVYFFVSLNFLLLVVHPSWSVFFLPKQHHHSYSNRVVVDVTLWLVALMFTFFSLSRLAEESVDGKKIGDFLKTNRAVQVVIEL